MALFKCMFCDKKFVNKEALLDHMEKVHKDELQGLPALQVYFNFKNRYALTKGYGKSILYNKPTKFNMTTGRYERFYDDSERKAYREYFRRNMIRKYGKDTLLNEPEQQKLMLANRHISGEYTWSTDPKEKLTYTGTYEKKFLEHLDLKMGWDNPNDIQAPAPQKIPYIYEGAYHFHIPDFYIESLDLIVNIKSSENKHYRLRDIEKEKAQDAVLKKLDCNYIKIFDNDFREFDKLVEESRLHNDKELVKRN